MRKLIGNEVCLHKKPSTRTPDFFGVLIDVTEDSLYLQEESGGVVIIPVRNVDYLTTAKMPVSAAQIRSDSKQLPPILAEHTPRLAPPEPKNKILSVVVDNLFPVSILAPPKFNLEQWHESIMTLALQDVRVREMLDGRVQKTVEYFPGELHIYTDLDEDDGGEEEEELSPQAAPSGGPNEFSMGSPMTSKFMSPHELITSVDKFKKKSQEK